MASTESTVAVELVRAANLQALPDVWHGFSTRIGGVSTVYSSGRGEMNLG